MTQPASIDKSSLSARKKLRTRKQAKAYLRRNGLSVPAFAKQHGFNEKAVRRVLSGELQGNYGDSHNIAVALGMKQPDPEVTPLLPGNN